MDSSLSRTYRLNGNRYCPVGTAASGSSSRRRGDGGALEEVPPVTAGCAAIELGTARCEGSIALLRSAEGAAAVGAPTRLEFVGLEDVGKQGRGACLDE